MLVSLFCLVLFLICIHFCYIIESSSAFLFLILINIYELLFKAQNPIASSKKRVIRNQRAQKVLSFNCPLQKYHLSRHCLKIKEKKVESVRKV